MFHIIKLFFFSPYNLVLVMLYRPHDRVPLKDMKDDWHLCLDNKVGFKVRSYVPSMISPHQF